MDRRRPDGEAECQSASRGPRRRTSPPPPASARDRPRRAPPPPRATGRPGRSCRGRSRPAAGPARSPDSTKQSRRRAGAARGSESGGDVPRERASRNPAASRRQPAPASAGRRSPRGLFGRSRPDRGPCLWPQPPRRRQPGRQAARPTARWRTADPSSRPDRSRARRCRLVARRLPAPDRPRARPAGRTGGRARSSLRRP